MKPADQLADFVGKALAQGRPRAEIAAALHEAGWQSSEVTRAMAAWADSGFVPPVPRPRDTVSARDAFGYGLLFTALCFSVFYINSLGFDLIDRWLGETDVDGYAQAWQLGSIRWAVSMLCVSVPVFVWLNRRQTVALQADPARHRSAIRKWLGYVTLFLAALGLAGDAIATIYALLNGDLTTQFALKAGLLLLTVGLVFAYYRLETESADAA